MRDDGDYCYVLALILLLGVGLHMHTRLYRHLRDRLELLENRDYVRGRMS